MLHQNITLHLAYIEDRGPMWHTLSIVTLYIGRSHINVLLKRTWCGARYNIKRNVEPWEVKHISGKMRALVVANNLACL